MKGIVILGSTGSIGVQALDVIKQMGRSVLALAAHSQVDAMERQIREYRPAYAVMFNEAAANDLRVRVADCDTRILAGMDGLCAIAALPQADIVLNAVVGMVGLQPTLAAMRAGHDVALANKETLVAGGELVMRTAREHNVRLLPVDSEHSAIFQCLQGVENGAFVPPMAAPKGVRRLILTASGGPFFGKTVDELKTVTPQDALRHPNWDMGAKITIDSATMMNKGLELIEARWLFDLSQENIDIVVHRESVIHSLVEFDDYSVLAQLGVPDMRIPIQYALTYPQRLPSSVKRLSLTEFGKLTFFEPDNEAFPCMELCRRALRQGGGYPAAANAANEVANAAFRQGRISMPRIAECIEAALDRPLPHMVTEQDVLSIDAECRRLTEQMI